MLWFSANKKIKELEERSEKSFASVKKDMDSVGKWVKHLESQDKHLFDIIIALREDLSSINEEVSSLREALEMVNDSVENKQVFKKLPVFDKQTPVEDVQKTVQTAVQTDNFYGVLKNLSSNERLIVFTLMNSELKLSYEDLAMLLGKERSTIRGQINAVKQKSEGLIEEMVEKNGKKRVFVPEEIRQMVLKSVKVRVKSERKTVKNEKN